MALFTYGNILSRHTKRKELEKACKKEKDHKVQIRIVAIRMVCVLSMFLKGTAKI